MVQEAEDSFGIIRVLERVTLGSSSFSLWPGEQTAGSIHYEIDANVSV